MFMTMKTTSAPMAAVRLELVNVAKSSASESTQTTPTST